MIAEFWFDPACPYSWTTSRWLVEAATVRPIEIDWRLLSLSVLNEHRDDDPEGDPEGYLWVPVRVATAVREQHGSAALGRFYERLWTQSETDDWIGNLETALVDAGLPRDLATAGEEWDATVRRSHSQGIALVGTHIGTPIIAVEGTAFFGPVISRIPRGEEAGHLWDAVVTVASTPGFHELKGLPPTPPER
jgi:hypothetical protein